MSAHKDHGYKDRNDYLESLSEEYGEDMVMALADILWIEEDFDGIVIELEHME